MRPKREKCTEAILKTEAERRAEMAERALREERDKVRFLTELLQGKAA